PAMRLLTFLCCSIASVSLLEKKTFTFCSWQSRYHCLPIRVNPFGGSYPYLVGASEIDEGAVNCADSVGPFRRTSRFAGTKPISGSSGSRGGLFGGEEAVKVGIARASKAAVSS